MKLHIRHIPSVVHKVPTRFAHYRGGEEEFSLWLQVLGPHERPVRRIRGVIRLYSGRHRVQETSAPASWWRSRVLARETVGRPGLYFLRFQVPFAAGVDKLTLNLDITARGRKLSRRLSVPLQRAQPQPLLHIPIEGGTYCFTDHNTRHGAEAGWFAVDLLGLGPEERVSRREPPLVPEHYYGFGRAVLSPARGIVIRTCDGVPDRDSLGDPAPRKSKMSFWQRKDWHLFGNHLVIAHGRHCYSLLAHLQQGTMDVVPAQHVEAGQPVGRVGHSGLSRMPHLHFQLMSGPDAFKSAPLPAFFGPVRIPPYGRFERAVLSAGTTVLPVGQPQPKP